MPAEQYVFNKYLLQKIVKAMIVWNRTGLKEMFQSSTLSINKANKNNEGHAK